MKFLSSVFKQTDGQTDRLTHRQTHRQTGRQIRLKLLPTAYADGKNHREVTVFVVFSTC